MPSAYPQGTVAVKALSRNSSRPRLSTGSTGSRAETWSLHTCARKSQKKLGYLSQYSWEPRTHTWKKTQECSLNNVPRGYREMRFLGEHTNKDFYTVTNHLGLNKDAHIDVANVVKRIWHYSLRQCAQWTYNGNTLLRGEQGLHLDKEIHGTRFRCTELRRGENRVVRGLWSISGHINCWISKSSTSPKRTISLN